MATLSSCAGPQGTMGLDYRVLWTLGNREEKEVHLEYRCTTWVQVSHTEHIFQGHLLILLLAAIGLSWRRLKYIPGLQGTESSEREGAMNTQWIIRIELQSTSTPQRENRDYGCLLLPKFGVDKKLHVQRGASHQGRFGFWLNKYLNVQCICFFTGILLFSNLIEAIL